MKEIFQKLNRDENQEIAEISIQTNPLKYIGGSVAKHHRLMLFDTNQDNILYIDFNPLKIESQKLYIVPFGHTLYLPPIFSDFYCLNIPTSSLNEFEKLWLFRQQFKVEKSVPCPNDFHTLSLHKNFLSKLFDTYLLLNQNKISLQYINQAETINKLLFETTLCHQLSVADLANKINVSPKTLHRVCADIFQEKPQYIIRYFLIVKAILHIVSNKMDSFSTISENLNFNDLGTFTRYIKSYTGISPKEIRDLHLNIIL